MPSRNAVRTGRSAPRFTLDGKRTRGGKKGQKDELSIFSKGVFS
jgi:hypothetical protein